MTENFAHGKAYQWGGGGVIRTILDTDIIKSLCVSLYLISYSSTACKKGRVQTFKILCQEKCIILYKFSWGSWGVLVFLGTSLGLLISFSTSLGQVL